MGRFCWSFWMTLVRLIFELCITAVEKGQTSARDRNPDFFYPSTGTFWNHLKVPSQPYLDWGAVIGGNLPIPRKPPQSTNCVSLFPSERFQLRSPLKHHECSPVCLWQCPSQGFGPQTRLVSLVSMPSLASLRHIIFGADADVNPSKSLIRHHKLDIWWAVLNSILQFPMLKLFLFTTN